MKTQKIILPDESNEIHLHNVTKDDIIIVYENKKFYGFVNYQYDKQQWTAKTIYPMISPMSLPNLTESLPCSVWAENRG